MISPGESGANMKYWEIIADNLSKAGWSWGCVATVDSNGRTIFVADAHCDDGKRFLCVRMKNSQLLWNSNQLFDLRFEQRANGIGRERLPISD